MSDLVHLPPYTVDFLHVPHSAQEGVDWGVAAYGIPELWRRTQGEGVTVAVVDSGIGKHYALNDVVMDHRNFSGDSDPYDSLGHGSHVAGVIASNKGLAQGIAPKAKLLSLKVLGHSGMGKTEAVAAAVSYATEANVDIVCMSLGSTRPDARLHEVIRHAHGKGVILVCAAGNDGGAVNYPAAFAETVAVGAVTKSGEACEFSSRGKEISVAAPGQDITSTWLADGYATISGTSMAAPFVAGVLALFVSERKANGEKVTHQDVVRALGQTSRDVGAVGKDDVYGWGLLDPHKLLAYTPQSVPGGVTIFIPGGKVV